MVETTDLIQELEPNETNNTLLGGTKIALFFRISRENEDIEKQKALLFDIAKRSNLNVLRTFEETYTGLAEASKRSKLQELIEFAREGNIQVVVFRAADRITRRSILEGLSLIKIFNDLGVKVWTYSEGYLKLDTPFDELMATIYFFKACQESIDISKRTKWGRQKLEKEIADHGFAISKSGKRITQVGGRKGVEVSQEELDEILHLRSLGYSLDTVANELQKRNSNITVKVIRRVIEAHEDEAKSI